MPQWPALALELELRLDPDDVRPLLRRFTGRRGKTLSIKWHDTAEGALAEQGLALIEQRQARATTWRLEPLAPGEETMWPCGTQAPVVQEGPSRLALDGALPADPLNIVASFRGRVRELTAHDPPQPRIALLQGTLHANAASLPVCRLTIAGSPPAVAAAAAGLAEDLRLSVAPATLSAEASLLAGREQDPGPLGAPEFSPDFSVGDAFAFACSHLERVILHYAPLAVAGQGTEPVHQMRVALRRLRSALALFRRVASCAEFDAAKEGLRGLARALGPARDWDVFVTGTGAVVADAFPAEPAVARMTGAAARRRDACYAGLRRMLDGPAFRGLGIALAVLAAARPWEAGAGAPGFGANAAPDALQEFAAHALSRRLKHLTAFDDDIDSLPAETLHSIRLRAKRLRYAVEMLAPLYPRREARRYLRRLAALQEQLGHLNDGAVAAALMAELGRAGGRGHAAGIVRGFVAAQTSGARARVGKSWRKFHRLEPFWA